MKGQHQRWPARRDLWVSCKVIGIVITKREMLMKERLDENSLFGLLWNRSEVTNNVRSLSRDFEVMLWRTPSP